MSLLVRNARIIDPSSAHHGKQADVLVHDGIITAIGQGLSDVGIEEVIEGDGLCVSIGWADLFATFGDPGLEHRETIVSGLDAAANGGFTKVCISPEAHPAIDTKSGVEYILKQAKGHVTEALPLAAATKRLESRELAEMFDMVRSGAAGISNGAMAIPDSKLMQLALQYASTLNVPFMSFAMDERMAHGGQMHEGEMSTRLGLKGIPALAEELGVIRDIYLSEYTGGAIHFSHVTTAGAVALIREAKAKGLRITASTPAHHLLYDDGALSGFDTDYKVSPPFRGREHVDALIEGLADGTIAAIITDHRPLEPEAKFCEFSQAMPGITALETAFPALLRATEGRLPLDRLIAKLTIGPRAVLGLPVPVIAEGQAAELTVFAPDMEWVYDAESRKSLSQNSPLTGQRLVGKAVAVVNGGSVRLV